MSATVSGAVKAVVEAAGLGLAAYRDRAPEGTSLPYVTVQEGLDRAVMATGDHGDPDGDMDVRELVQVDLWQQRLHPATGQRLEDYLLPGRLVRALHGAHLPDVGAGRVFKTSVQSSLRLSPGPGVEDTNLVRDTLTLQVIRSLT